MTREWSPELPFSAHAVCFLLHTKDLHASSIAILCLVPGAGPHRRVWYRCPGMLSSGKVTVMNCLVAFPWLGRSVTLVNQAQLIRGYLGRLATSRLSPGGNKRYAMSLAGCFVHPLFARFQALLPGICVQKNLLARLISPPPPP